MSFGSRYNTRGSFSNNHDETPVYGRNLRADRQIGSYRGQFKQTIMDQVPKENSARPSTFYSTDIIHQTEYHGMNSLKIRCEDYFLISQNLLDKEGQNVVIDAMNHVRPRFSRRIFMNQNPTTQQRPPVSAKFEMIEQYKEPPRTYSYKVLKVIYPQDDSKAIEADYKITRNELPDTKNKDELIVCTIGNSYKNPTSGIDEKKFETIVKKVCKDGPQSSNSQSNNRNIYGNPTYPNPYGQPEIPKYGQNPVNQLFQPTQNLAANPSNVPNIFQQNNQLPLFNNQNPYNNNQNPYNNNQNPYNNNQNPYNSNQNPYNNNPIASMSRNNLNKAPWSQNNTNNVNNLFPNKTQINIFDKTNSGQNNILQTNSIYQQTPLFQQNNYLNPYGQNPYGQQNLFTQQNYQSNMFGQNPFAQQNSTFAEQVQNYDNKFILAKNQKGFRQFEQFYNTKHENKYTNEQIFDIFKQVVDKFSEAESKYKGDLVMNQNNQQIFQFHPDEGTFVDFMKNQDFKNEAATLKYAISNVSNYPQPVYHCNPQGIRSIEVLPYNGTFNLENQSYILVPDKQDPKKVKLIPTDEVYKFTQNLMTLQQMSQIVPPKKQIKYQQLESIDERIILFDSECEGEDINFMYALKQKVYQEYGIQSEQNQNQQQAQQKKLKQTGQNKKMAKQKPQTNQNVEQAPEQIQEHQFKIEVKQVQSQRIEAEEPQQDDDQTNQYQQSKMNDELMNQHLTTSRLVGEKFNMENKDSSSQFGYQSTRVNMDNKESNIDEKNQNQSQVKNVSYFEIESSQVQNQYVYHLKIKLTFLEFDKSFYAEFIIIEIPESAQQLVNFIIDKIWQNQQISEEEKQAYKLCSRFYHQKEQLQRYRQDMKNYLRESEINDEGEDKHINNFRLELIRTETPIFDERYTYQPELDQIEDFANVPYLQISNQFGFCEWQDVNIAYVDFRNLLVIKPDCISMYCNVIPYLKPEVGKKLNKTCRVTFYMIQFQKFRDETVAKQKCRLRGYEFLGQKKVNGQDAYSVLLNHFSEHQFNYLYESDDEEEQSNKSYEYSDQEEDLPYIDQFYVSESETKIHSSNLPDLRIFQDYERPIRRKLDQDDDHQQMVHDLIETLCCDDQNSVDNGEDMALYKHLEEILDDQKQPSQDVQRQNEQLTNNLEETKKKEYLLQQKQNILEQKDDIKLDDYSEVIELLEKEIQLIEAEQKYIDLENKRKNQQKKDQGYQNNYKLNFEPYEIVLLEQNKFQTDPIAKNILLLFFQDVFGESDFPKYSFSKACLNIIYTLRKLQEEYTEYEWNQSVYSEWIPCVELLNILFGNSSINLLKTSEKMDLEEILQYQEDLFGDTNNLMQRRLAFTHWCTRQLEKKDQTQEENEWPLKFDSTIFKKKKQKVDYQSWWDKQDIPFKKVTNLKQAIYVLFREKISKTIVNPDLQEQAVQFLIKDYSPLSYIFWFVLAKEDQVTKVSSIAKIEQMSQFDGLQDIVAMFIDVLTEKCQIFSLKERNRIKERIALFYGSGTENLSKSHFIGYTSESREFNQKAYDMKEVPGHGLMVDQYILPYLACYDLELAKEVAKESTEAGLATQALQQNGEGNIRELLLTWPKSDVFWMEFKEIMMNLL